MAVDELRERLEALVYMVLSVRRDVSGTAEQLARYSPPEQQRFVAAVETISRTSVELAYNFCVFAPAAVPLLGVEEWQAWVLHIMERYDEGGVLASIVAMQKVREYQLARAHSRTAIAFEEVSLVLERLVLGLNGRSLKLASGDEPYTDTETLYLPASISRFARREDNYRLYKAMAVHLWAQTWYGTWRLSLRQASSHFDDPARAVRLFHGLEILRLDACIARELPGISREMQHLREATDRLPEAEDAAWAWAAARLREPAAGVEDSYALLPHLYQKGLEGAAVCYQGTLFPERTEEMMALRLQRDRQALSAALAEMQWGLRGKGETALPQERESAGLRAFMISDPQRAEGFRVGLHLDGEPIVPPEDVQQLLDSIAQDLGEVPEEYLVAAGDGVYRADEVGSGGREEGGMPDVAGEAIFLYDEWDYARKHYRRNWCLVRERVMHPQWTDFVERTLEKHQGVRKRLRRTFEALRGDDRRLKRQPEGDEVDLDAVVETYGDMASGLEGSDRLFSRLRRVERNLAVMFMVDMSGSTKGWINDIERESLVLLCECLEILGDRYAIYGFSGFTHKRCEILRIKHFTEPYGPEVRARICGILPQDYTRMGAAIRHLSKLLLEVDARTRLLITLSDGKPDDQDGYRGAYGIEDTRQALLEARYQGIHPYCITIDEEGMEYLPRLYGPAAFTVISQVQKLPYRVSDIYRRLTR